MAAQNMYKSLVTTAAVLVHAWSGVQCAPLCLSGDFDSQLRHILHKQMLSEQDPADIIISRVLDDVRSTLNQRWQGYELIICGSLANGLATISSDVDLVARLPNFNESAGLYVLQETEKLFKKQPELYSRLRYRNKSSFITAFFSYFHIPSQRTVEIEFTPTGEFGVSNSQLVRYYFKLDKRSLPLGGFLKYWFRIHGVTGHGPRFLPNYGLYMLIIFYLQQKNMAPPGYMLQVDSKSHFIEYWDMGFNELPYTSTNTENLHQLLGGFFKYYSEFNFEEYIVAPFTGRPIPRTAFKDIDNFPVEYTLYNNTLKRIVQLMIQNDLNCTDICIQDVFDHALNTGLLLSHELATKFKYLMKSVATMFEDLPSDSILRAILVTDQHKETVVINDNAAVDGVNERDCIEVPDT